MAWRAVVQAADAPHEQRHDLVADQLVYHRVVPDEGLGGGCIEAGQHLCERPGRHPLTECRRSAYVGEQDGDVDLRAACRERVTTAGAEVWILARGPKPRHSQDPAADAAEWVVAKLAARRRRHVAEDVTGSDQWSVTVAQHTTPRLG